MIALFCFRLICGASLCWALMPRRQVTCGFFRIQHLVVLGLSVLAALTLTVHGAPSSGATASTAGMLRAAAIAIAIIAYAGSIIWMLGRRMLGLVSVMVILALSCAAMMGSQSLLTEAAGVQEKLLVALSELSSAAILGTALTGMLLGHWYLTAPAMPLAPLVRMDRLFGAGVLCLVTAGVGLLTCPAAVSNPLHLVWLALHGLGGIGGPLILAVLIGRILKYRNTQAATGVFFAGVILVFMGELAAMLLTNELRHPL